MTTPPPQSPDAPLLERIIEQNQRIIELLERTDERQLAVLRELVEINRGVGER